MSDAIVESEINRNFRKRKDQALSVSFHKYGPLREGFPHKVNAVACIKQRLKLYEETGNTDYLVDVSNFAEIEFTYPSHPNYHDKPTDGGEGRVWHGKGQSVNLKNDGERI